MTEIPEHLLKRAQARRAAMGGSSGDAPAADTPAKADAPAAAAATPAAPKKVAPLPTLDSEPEKVEADIPVVAAAKGRKKVPYWVAPILLLLPIWGWIYRDSVTEQTKVETNPITIGSEIFSSTCAGCHGPDGAGTAAGAQLNEGHTVETFEDPLSMTHWIAYGWSEGRKDNDTYGDAGRPAVTGSMPAFRTSLSAADIAAVTIYLRSEFGGDLYDETAERGFTVEAYEADPDALAAQVQAVIDLGPGGEPDVESVDRAE